MSPANRLGPAFLLAATFAFLPVSTQAAPASLLLDFGPTTVTGADKILSLGHFTGAVSSIETNWNQITNADFASGLVYADGAAATGVSVTIGRSDYGTSNPINFGNKGIKSSALGGALNTGIYANTSPMRDGIFTDGNAAVNTNALGIRIDGLSAGTYTLYLAGRNTSTAYNTADERFFATNGASSTTFAFNTNATPYADEVNPVMQATNSFFPETNCAYLVVTLGAGDSLYLAAVGTTPLEYRGFLNSLEIIPGTPAFLPTAVVLLSSAQTNGYGDTEYFTATNLPVGATGKVVFEAGGVPFGTSSVANGGATSSMINSLPRGTNIITGIYMGAGLYSGSTNTLNQIITNHPPTASLMTVTRTAGLSLQISLSDMTTNWIDLDGDHVSLTGVTMQSTNGINLIALNWSTNLDGSIATSNDYAYIGYTNSPNVADELSYSISDGHGGTNIGHVDIMIKTSVTGTNSITALDFTSAYSNTITAYGIPNFNYILERATNLTSPVWVDIQTNLANPTNGIIKAADTFWDLNGVKPNPSAFYQLKWQP